jgi:hypothetical protein
VPACAGLAIGLLRPLSYLWEALLSLSLALAARLGVSPLRLLRFHPVSYDDLCLLPLPGLTSLLVRGCASDLEAGGDWLLYVARHQGQRRAALRAVARAPYDLRLAHPLLFWLSTSSEGAALLNAMVERGGTQHPLIAAYASFAVVPSPDHWPFVLAQQRAAIGAAAQQPGGRAMLALLEAGVATLRADRWPDAIAQLEATPAPAGVEADPIWSALAAIQTWSRAPAPVEVVDRAASVRAIVAELQDLDGWPIALIAAMCEHLLFLIGIERRRGAWLV